MSRTGSPHIDTLCITSLPGGIEKVLFWYMSILFLPHVSPWRATLSRDPSQWNCRDALRRHRGRDQQKMSHQRRLTCSLVNPVDMFGVSLAAAMTQSLGISYPPQWMTVGISCLFAGRSWLLGPTGLELAMQMESLLRVRSGGLRPVSVCLFTWSCSLSLAERTSLQRECCSWGLLLSRASSLPCFRWHFSWASACFNQTAQESDLLICEVEKHH